MRARGPVSGRGGGRGGAVALGCIGVLFAFAACALGGVATGSARRGDDKPPRSVDADCPVCKGGKFLTDIGCSKCSASGYILTTQCKTCNGSARVTYNCPSCEGKGELTFRGKTVDCPTCKGEGSFPCLACGGKGTIRRPNPDAAPWPTTDCTHCAATGFEQKEKCRRCAGRGTLTHSSGDALTAGQLVTQRNRDATAVTFDCPFCGGDGEGPPLCRACHGKGYVGSSKSPVPCRACFATGRAFTRCRMCAGRAWVRAPKGR